MVDTMNGAETKEMISVVAQVTVTFAAFVATVVALMIPVLAAL